MSIRTTSYYNSFNKNLNIDNTYIERNVYNHTQLLKSRQHPEYSGLNLYQIPITNSNIHPQCTKGVFYNCKQPNNYKYNNEDPIINKPIKKHNFISIDILNQKLKDIQGIPHNNSNNFNEEFIKYFNESFIKYFNENIIIKDNSNNTKKIDDYAILSHTIKQINELFIDFAAGNFKKVADILTVQKYAELSLTLHSLYIDSPYYDDYENIRKTFMKTLEGLMKGVYQYLDIVNLNNKLISANDKLSILKDVERLKELINALNNSNKMNNLFTNSNISILSATLKPEYQEYISLYGFPENCIFDKDKLAVCIENVSKITAFNSVSRRFLSNTAANTSDIDTAASSSGIDTATNSSDVNTAANSSDVNTAANSSLINTAANSSYINTAANSSYINTAANSSLINTAANSSYINTAANSSYINTAANSSDIDTASNSSGSVSASRSSGCSTPKNTDI